MVTSLVTTDSSGIMLKDDLLAVCCPIKVAHFGKAVRIKGCEKQIIHSALNGFAKETNARTQTFYTSVSNVIRHLVS